jgi:hypothetical protein
MHWRRPPRLEPPFLWPSRAIGCRKHKALLLCFAQQVPSSSTSEIAPAKRILLTLIRSGPLSQGRDSGLQGRLGCERRINRSPTMG